MTNPTTIQLRQLRNKAKAHNNSIDNFINITLKEHFGTDELNFLQWFEAKDLISKQKFFQKGYAILKFTRSFGIDCKMDVQSKKLHCPELDVYAY